MEMFTVGGWVRDQILGVPSKDIDFTVVLTAEDAPLATDSFGAADPFKTMVLNLQGQGFTIFLESPEFLTVRAQFPKGDLTNMLPVINDKSWKGGKMPVLTADFVLARKESDYTDGRRPDEVIPGTLEDDLARRDFTMNAIARDTQGNFIDPHNGRQDIARGIIRAVGDPFERLSEDALRAVRALRFSVTKGFNIDLDLRFAMETAAVLDAIVNNISDERIKDELSKMLRHDSLESIRALNRFPLLTNAMFSGTVNLDATMKQKGFK